MLQVEAIRRALPVSDLFPFHISAIDLGPRDAVRTLILLHGFGGSAEDWRPQLDHFSSSYRVVAIDLRGHGQSSSAMYSSGLQTMHGSYEDYTYVYSMELVVFHYFDVAEGIRNAPAPVRRFIRYSLTAMQADLQRVIAELKVKPPITLIGHSLGGALATEYALKNSRSVDQLILIATPSNFKLNFLLSWLIKLPYFMLGWLKVLGLHLDVLKNVWRSGLRGWEGTRLFESLRIPTLFVHTSPKGPFADSPTKTVPASIPRCAQVKLKSLDSPLLNRAIEDFLLTHP